MTMLRIDPTQPDAKLVAAMIKYHTDTLSKKYKLMQEYYEGNHFILQRKSDDANKPNNKLVNNFPSYIVDVTLGYFLGKPVAYSASGEGLEAMMEDIAQAFDYNDEADQNVDLGKIMGIKGHAFELLYVDDSDEAMPRFDIVKPSNVLVAYDKTIAAEPSLAIRFFADTEFGAEETDDQKTYTVEFYDKNYKYPFKLHNDKLTQDGSPVQHHFDAVPIIEYPNNDERQSDFEKVLTLIDAYDKAQSDTLNDFEYFADAYLKIRNMSATTDQDIADMKKNRTILLDSDGEADWLIKDFSSEASESYKKRMQADIHRFSKTPNLTDESFAQNLSGVAIEYKLWGLEQAASQKERKFKRALQRRLKLLTNFWRYKSKDYDWREVNITFTRNVPQNLKEIAEVVQMLKGIVSDTTGLALLPFVDDPQKEAERLLYDSGNIKGINEMLVDSYSKEIEEVLAKGKKQEGEKGTAGQE